MEKQFSYPDMKQSLGLLLRWLVYSLLAYIVVRLLHLDASVPASEDWYIFFIVRILTYSLPLILVIGRAYNLKRRYAGLPSTTTFVGNAKTRDLVLFALLALLVSFFIDPLLLPFRQPTGLNKIMMNEMTGLIAPNFLSFILIVILPPILEELLFRGVILDGLLKNMSSRLAILISSALFGVIHMNPLQFVTAFILGLLIGWVYQKTRSLLACMIMHATTNGIAWGYFLLFSQKMFLSEVLSGTPYILTVAFSFVAFLFLLYIASKRMKGRRLTNDNLQLAVDN